MVDGKRSKVSERKPARRTISFDAIEPNKAYPPHVFCELIGIRRKTLGEWRRRKAFPVRDTGRDGLIHGSDVLDWLLKQPLRGQSPA